MTIKELKAILAGFPYDHIPVYIDTPDGPLDILSVRRVVAPDFSFDAQTNAIVLSTEYRED